MLELEVVVMIISLGSEPYLLDINLDLLCLGLLLLLFELVYEF